MSTLRRLTLPGLATWLTFAGIFAMAFRLSVDTDTWWHLRAGAWMVAHHQLLTVDQFSTTRFGQPWINHSWLSQFPWLQSRIGGRGLGGVLVRPAPTGLLSVDGHLRLHPGQLSLARG